MFEFFLALFGGTYLGAKLLSERSAIKSFDEKCDKHRKIDEEYEQLLVAPYELREEVKKRILSGNNVNEIYEELKDDLMFVFGENYREKFFLPWFRVYGDIGDLRHSKYWAYHLLLSHKGKVDCFTYSHGFPIGGIEDKDKNIKICQRIEYNLQLNGINTRLVMRPGTADDERRWNPCGKDIIFEHKLYWEIDPEQCRLW